MSPEIKEREDDGENKERKTTSRGQEMDFNKFFIDAL